MQLMESIDLIGGFVILGYMYCYFMLPVFSNLECHDRASSRM